MPCAFLTPCRVFSLSTFFFFFFAINYCPNSTNALDWAAARGHQDVVYFLIANRKEGCTGQALDWSSHGGHDKINHSLSERAKVRVSFRFCLLLPLLLVVFGGCRGRNGLNVFPWWWWRWRWRW